MYRLTRMLSPDLPPKDWVAVSPDWTRAEFNRAVFALSYRLRQQGVRTAALWFDDAAYFACALLAAWHAGARVLLPPNTAEDSRKWAEENGAVWLHDAADGRFADGRAYRLPDCLAALPDAPESYRAVFDIAEEAVLALKTSGSSGQAQIVEKTAAQLADEAQALCGLLPFGQQAVSIIGSVSPQHLYGLSFRIALPLTAAWPIGRLQNVYPETLSAATAQAEKCVWISSPALLKRMGKERDWAAIRPKLAGIVSSGGVLPSAASALLAETAVEPLEIYGSTETGVIAARRGDALWQPLAGVETVRAEDETLGVSSPWSGGWRQTADVVRLADGGFELLGRKDRIVKFEDKRVSLAQIEQDLLNHPWIADAYCGLHPTHTRPAVWAALNADGIDALCSQGRAAVAAALKRHLAKTQDTVALPRYWRFAAQLPRNAQSKIRAADFRTAFGEAQIAPQWTETPAEAADGIRRFTGIVPLDLAYFGGHFAEFPLVPGVIELQWVRDLAEYCGWRQSLLRVENLKYQQFVRPNDELAVELAYDEAKAKLGFKILKNGQNCASGRLVFGVFGAEQ